VLELGEAGGRGKLVWVFRISVEDATAVSMGSCRFLGTRGSPWPDLLGCLGGDAFSKLHSENVQLGKEGRL